MFAHLLPVAGQVFIVNNRELDSVLTEKVRKRLLPVKLAELPQIAVTPAGADGACDWTAVRHGAGVARYESAH